MLWGLCHRRHNEYPPRSLACRLVLVTVIAAATMTIRCMKGLGLTTIWILASMLTMLVLVGGDDVR